MEVVAYRPEHLRRLTCFYNDLVRDVPHCHPIDSDELAAAFAGECGYESGGEVMSDEAVFVVANRDVIGFVHVGRGRHQDRDQTKLQGNIRFLAYQRGHRDVVQALLTQAEAWFRQQGLDSALVYRQTFRYRFYHLSHALVSNHLDHIQALLQQNGYRACGGEIFLDWPNMAPDVADRISSLDVELAIEHVRGQGKRPDLKVTARRRGKEIGQCDSLNARTFSNRDSVEDWIFTNWLGVDEPFQGSGLGRHLLNAALCEAYRLGYRHAAISASESNHRALLFYANCGYRAVDWTKQFYRELS